MDKRPHNVHDQWLTLSIVLLLKIQNVIYNTREIETNILLLYKTELKQ